MKYFISTIIGLLTGIICISVLQYLVIFLFPLPVNIDMQDIDSISDNMENIPLINLIMVIVSYALASIIAGLVSIKLKTPQPHIPIILIGVILTAFSFINFLTIPHPLWMIVVGSATFIPMTWLGGKLGEPKLNPKTVYKF